MVMNPWKPTLPIGAKETLPIPMQLLGFISIHQNTHLQLNSYVRFKWFHLGDFDVKPYFTSKQGRFGVASILMF